MLGKFRLPKLLGKTGGTSISNAIDLAEIQASLEISPIKTGNTRKANNHTLVEIIEQDQDTLVDYSSRLRKRRPQTLQSSITSISNYDAGKHRGK